MIPLDELEAREERAEFTARELDELGQARAAALHRTEAQAISMKRRHDQKLVVQSNYFKINDWVKLKNHQSNKFEFEWKGPYVVVDYGLGKDTYYIMEPNGRRLDSTVAQVELAPWLEPLEDGKDFFYDGTRRAANEQAPSPLVTRYVEEPVPAQGRRRLLGKPIRMPGQVRPSEMT
jgi:hypothetical protein